MGYHPLSAYETMLREYHARNERQRAHRATFTITPEEAKTDPDQLDIAECAKYDRKADYRKAEYEADLFRDAIDLLFSRREATK
jgi:hypothetical protein